MNTNNLRISPPLKQPGKSSQWPSFLYLGFPSSVFTLDPDGVKNGNLFIDRETLNWVLNTLRSFLKDGSMKVKNKRGTAMVSLQINARQGALAKRKKIHPLLNTAIRPDLSRWAVLTSGGTSPDVAPGHAGLPLREEGRDRN